MYSDTIHICKVASGAAVIRSFKSKALRRYWIDGDGSSLPADQIKRIRLRLSALDVATRPEDLDIIGWRFHALKGEMKGRFAINVTSNWRITFAWDGEHADAIDVDHEDYH